MNDRLVDQVLKLFTLNDEQREAATETGRDVVVTGRRQRQDLHAGCANLTGERH